MKIIISGAVGAGKSTLMHALNQYFTKHNKKVFMVDEYISTKLGEDLLISKINGSVRSQVLQAYILSYWEQISKNESPDVDYQLFERDPVDSVTMFAMKDYITNPQSRKDFLVNEAIGLLYQWASELNKDLGLENPEKFTIDVDNMSVDDEIDAVEHILHQCKTGVVKITLNASPDTLLQRIKIRNRYDSSYYSKDDVEFFNSKL